VGKYFQILLEIGVFQQHTPIVTEYCNGYFGQ